MHNHPEGQAWELSQQFTRFLRWHDGTNVMLADKSEAGWMYIPERFGSEIIPEHVHHNYLYTDAYEKSRASRGKEAASHGMFLAKDKFHPTEKW